jgi:uncharacterized protein
VSGVVPVREGLFTADPPRLVGSRCGACGRFHFPAHRICPFCAASRTTPVELSPDGRLWAFTAVTAAPPGYHGDVPFGFGVVELAEGIRVISRLTESDPERLSLGQAVHLQIVPLHVDDGGNQVVTYAFAPDRPPATAER